MINSRKILLTVMLFVATIAPSVYGKSKADLAVSKESQIASGIISRRLTPSFHRREIKAYGQVVDLGNLIGLMNSYATVRAQVLRANLQLDLSRNEYERARKLFKSKKLVSLENLQDAEAAYKSDFADSEAAFRNLLGVRGEIVERWGDVVAGWITENSRTAVDLENRKTSLIIVTVPHPRRRFQPPGVAKVTTSDGTFLKARFVSSSPVTDPKVQGLSYIYRTSSTPSLPLRMNVVAFLPVGKMDTGVVIPESAVIWMNGKSWVFLKIGKGEFVKKDIRTNDSVAGGWFIDHGIKPGDEVVVKGAQLLLSQQMKSNMQAVDD